MAYPTPSTIPAAPAAQDSQAVKELSVPIHQARGWLQFLGVLSILGGVGQALSVVGILWAWVPIWMGVLLFQAGSNIESAAQSGDKSSFLRSMGNLKTYFVIQGILTLIAILIVVGMLCILFILPLLGVTLVPWQQIINNAASSGY
jgi:hypothetical protein